MTTDRIQKGEEMVIINTNLFNKKYKKVLMETVVVTDITSIDEGVVECKYSGYNFAGDLTETLVLPLLVLKRKNQLNDDEYDMYLEVNKNKLFASKSTEIAHIIIKEYKEYGHVHNSRITELCNTIAGLYEFDKHNFMSLVLSQVITITKTMKEGK
ncbi:hypothetical protein NIGALANA_279 [Bacillus phage Nigalana]|uniref:hypothetical protein n=1 Tax=Bacillus phage Nigalana TaxID=1805951 RepID=UPI0007A768D9|nr:hypothetical protein BI005_gp279 [Bacillus phage Nigalana]AMW61425.1 hypothetical protein NIGALANA_279 [Bacillus phage Nigalana]AXQ67380.1 hypothetical protein OMNIODEOPRIMUS_277 [Bacillus phage OmnioDeoPrimus]